MSESVDGGETVEGDSSALTPPIPEFVDWIAGTVVALAGMALTVGGSALTFVVDRTMLEEGIESGEITVIVFERDLTRAETIEFTTEVVSWTGIGVLVTGVAMVLFAVGYVVVRHRARGAAGEEPPETARSNAVLGAVAAAVLFFLPVSPLVGGAVAGYLDCHRSEGGRSVGVGALSGFLSVAPGLVILAFVTAGLFAGLAAVGETGLGAVTVAAMLFAVLFVVAYGAGLGALGGFAGGRLAESQS